MYWDLGYEAYFNGVDVEDNPFDKGMETVLWCDWQDGWYAALDADRKHDERIANHIDGYDRDDLGYSGDY